MSYFLFTNMCDYCEERIKNEFWRKFKKQRGVTQEELAEMLGVSRQAISKWESDSGYPETQKLLVISKTLQVSIDYLLNDQLVIEEKKKTEEKSVICAPTGKIAITTYDNKNMVFCHSVKAAPIMWPGKDEPKYILNGVDKVTFWGDHTIILGWYETLEDIEKEISEVTQAIQSGESTYKLKYNVDVVDRTFGFPKLKKS